MVVPGGSLNDPKRTCSNLCHIKSVNGRIHQRSCSDLEDFPDDYEAVSGDSTKRCKRSRADSIKDCLCDSDLCNVDTMAAPSNTAIPSTIASFTLILTSLLLTKEVLMWKHSDIFLPNSLIWYFDSVQKLQIHKYIVCNQVKQVIDKTVQLRRRLCFLATLSIF